MDQNRRFAEMNGIYWHERWHERQCYMGFDFVYSCSCGASHFNGYADLDKHIRESNTDFSDPCKVLKVVGERDDWPRFLDSIGGMHNCYDYGHGIIWKDWIEIDYITTPGKLRDAWIEWLVKQTEGGRK